MIQKLVIGLLSLVLAVITPMVILDHTRTTSQIQTLIESSYLSYLEVTKLKKQVDFSQIRAATHLLYVPDLGNGSGVMIAPGRMLTAAHVAAITEDYPLLLAGKPVKVLKIDKELDLALLEVEMSCPCVSVAEQMPKVDSTGYLVGYPLQRKGTPQFLTEGRIQGLNEEAHRIFTSADAAPGNSGGGLFVFNKDQWELVGILVEIEGMGNIFMPSMVHFMSRSVDTESIKKFLN